MAIKNTDQRNGKIQRRQDNQRRERPPPPTPPPIDPSAMAGKYRGQKNAARAIDADGGRNHRYHSLAG